jgi:hypothetical protein
MSLASILTIFMISLERFFVTCKPLKVKQIITHSHTLIIIAFIWFVSIIVNLPFVFLAEYKLTLFFDNNKYEYKCSSVAGNEWMVVYSVSVTFVIHLIIGIILTWMFHKISVGLKNSTKAFQVKSSNSCSKQLSKQRKSSQNKSDNEMISLKSEKNSTFISSDSYHNSTLSTVLNKQDRTLLSINSDLEKYMKPRRQIIKMLMCVIIVFYICFFPLKIWVLILMFFGSTPWFLDVIQFKQYWYVSITCRIFFYANSSLNPILYNCLSKKFRQSFKRLYLFKFFFPENVKNLTNLLDSEKNESSYLSRQKQNL